MFQAADLDKEGGLQVAIGVFGVITVVSCALAGRLPDQHYVWVAAFAAVLSFIYAIMWGVLWIMRKADPSAGILPHVPLCIVILGFVTVISGVYGVIKRDKCTSVDFPEQRTWCAGAKRSIWPVLAAYVAVLVSSGLLYVRAWQHRQQTLQPQILPSVMQELQESELSGNPQAAQDD